MFRTYKWLVPSVSQALLLEALQQAKLSPYDYPSFYLSFLIVCPSGASTGGDGLDGGG